MSGGSSRSSEDAEVSDVTVAIESSQQEQQQQQQQRQMIILARVTAGQEGLYVVWKQDEVGVQLHNGGQVWMWESTCGRRTLKKQ